MGGVVEAEGFAFKEYAVVVDEHRAVNEFECSLAVILKVADCIEGVGIVAFRFNLEAQFYCLPLCDFVAVGHDFHSEGIRLLYVEVIGAGGQCEDESEKDCPKSEEAGGCEAGFADFVDDCFHDFQSLSFVDFFG